MKTEMASGKGMPDPHDWVEVQVDAVLRADHSITLKQYEHPGYVCRRCRTFIFIRPHRVWNPWRPEDLPCTPNGASS